MRQIIRGCKDFVPATLRTLIEKCVTSANKEDKFIYLSIVAELIQALDHDYQSDQRYTYLAMAKPLSAEKIFEIIADKDNNLLTKMHPPIDSSIDIHEHEGHLNVRLSILFRG